MNKAGLIAGTVLGLTLGACASAPPATERNQTDKILVSGDGTLGTLHSYQDPGVSVAKYKSPRNVVVPALKEAYEELGIPVKVADAVSGQVGNNFFVKHWKLGDQALSHYLQCGNSSTGPAADNYKITLSVLSLVSPDSAGSKVNTVVQARADDSAGSSGSVQCQTTGFLESDLNRILLRRLGDREL
jgi:hypothetical protein